MIKKSEAHKVYGRDTQVIRKGDRRWKSDRENWQVPTGMREDDEYKQSSQRHILNPNSLIDQKIRQRASAEVDTTSLESFMETSPLGTRMEVEHGKDLVTFELREDPRKGRYWRTCYRQVNGAL
jgi:hypothetical protein